MSVPFFTFKPIEVSNTNSWPDSPDRTATSAGRDAYADPHIQQALHSTPAASLTLSDCLQLLAGYRPASLGGNIVYESDPILALIQYAHERNSHIVDDSFPAQVWWNAHTEVVRHRRLKDKISAPCMYSKTPSLLDMNQVSLGDCGFVSTVGAISIHPQGHNLLFSAIYPPVYNPIGLYSVRIIDGDEIRYLLVDDDLPDEYYSSMEDPNEFWYLIIEKAFAKFGGGYAALGGGYEKRFGMTSTSNFAITNDNQEEVWWNHFLQDFQTNHLTTYQGTGGSPAYLVRAHAYAIIDAAGWDRIRLVRLHNPWNAVKYSGEYCPTDNKHWDAIPESVRRDVFQTDRFVALDGQSPLTFWMPYAAYWHDIPKISTLYQSSVFPRVLLSIANADSIQG